jgi:hypothetical protein
MKPVLLWTPQAREDLLDIYVTIGFDSPPGIGSKTVRLASVNPILAADTRQGWGTLIGGWGRV